VQHESGAVVIEDGMRAIRFENAGNADVIKLVDEPFPQLRPHDLLVRVRAAGLDRAEGTKSKEHGGKSENTV
jgi:NADPH2:quinone reductase